MISRKRTVAVVVLTAATALSMAACSSSKKTPPSTGGTSSTAANLRGTSFTILGQWTGGEETAFQAVVNAFDRQTGATGHYTPAAGGDEATVLGTEVAGGTPPDVAILSLPGDIDSYAKSGKIKPLDAAVQSAVAANFSSEWATLATYNGQLYGVPVDASDKSTVWYNAKDFTTAGITSPPTTWQQLITDAKTLSDSGVTVPISVGGGDGWTLTDWFENVYIRTAGVANYDKLTHHQIPWTDPSVATALNTLNQIWAQPSLIGSASKALATPFTSSVDNVFKANPTSAIVYEASFVATTITSDKDPAVVGTDAKVFPFPSVNGSAPVLEAAGDFAVPFTSNAAIGPFLQFLASAQASQLLVSTAGSGFLTANKNMPASDYPDATSMQLGQQLVSVGDNFRFDMSDQAPAEFGGTPNKGEWADLQAFLGNHNVAATQAKLESDAKAVSWS